MGKFDGKYVKESDENLQACMAAIGLPETLVKKMLDPKNVITLTVMENSNGSYTSSTEMSLCPEMNQTETFKIGETLKVEKPWPMEVTVTKTNETTWVSRNVTGGKTIVSEMSVNNYGMSLRGTIEGTALSFTEQFKKVSPKVSGFYTLENERGLADVMKIVSPKMEASQFEQMKGDLAFKIKEESNGWQVEERFGGENKVYSFKLDEEYNYFNQAYDLDEKRVSTRVGPGVYKTLCKNKKNGKTWEFTLSFNEIGFAVHVKAGGLEANECWKRLPDIEGTWRMVAEAGIEQYMAAIGISSNQIEEIKARAGKDYFILERLAGNKIRCTTNSKMMPPVTIIKVGETYTMETEYGKVEGVYTELGNTVINVWRFNGKTIRITEKISGDFMVTEYVVDGNVGSTMKAIQVRD